MEKIIATINIPTVGLLALFCCVLFLIGIVIVLLVILWKIKYKFEILRVHANNNLGYCSHVPSLINLPVRHDFIKFLAEIFPLAKERKEKLALLFLDLDNLKNINDTLSIEIGDLLLAQVAHRIITEVKINSHIISHFGGGEFVILIGFYDETTHYIANIAEKLLRAINNNFRITKHDILMTASIGICIFPDHTDDPENLLKYADMARYNAKQCGKNIYCFYNESINQKTRDQTLMHADLGKALEKNEFIVYYQPKIRAPDGAILGAEALIRWQHPTKGLISPDIFIPIAEDFGLIIAIGNWILRTVCLALKKLQTINLTNFTIAINVSPYQFNQGDIAGIIASTLWETGVNPALLELELTESLIMKNAEKSLLMLRVLKVMGVKVAIDDFGTGYSSLSILQNFPIDTLKIDKSFIKNMHLNADSITIVNTIISMAKQLGLEIVAEGVEHQEEADLLTKEGCDYLQGYLYSPPVPIEQLMEMIKK